MGKGTGEAAEKAEKAEAEAERLRPVPEGWQRVWSKSVKGACYYWHEGRGINQVEFPEASV